MLKNYSRELILLVVVVIMLFAFMGKAPVAQNLDYHAFVDTRAYFDIPNFFDVISNAAFFITGLIGLIVTLVKKPTKAYSSWVVFYLGVILVSPGSAYYHWTPNNQTLVWDRLPMTVGFVGLFCALIALYINEKLAKLLLLPCLALGAWSVYFWSQHDDLRLYFFVQFMPLALIPLMAIMFRDREVKSRYLIIPLSFYVLAKIVEHKDPEIYAITKGFLSGHTLKHYLAAIAPLFLMKLMDSGRDSKITVSTYKN